jgi:hypothetical protein
MITKNKNTNKILTNFLIALILALVFGVLDVRLEKNSTRPHQINSNEVLAVEPVSTPSPTQTPIPDTPEEYIKYKFGKDADKAFLLLKGKGEGTCAENRTLDQKLVNDNTWWGGKGKDWGIFQINDYYHPVFELNLHKDWKANIDYAYKMFVNDGRTFKRWTCGRMYGI